MSIANIRRTTATQEAVSYSVERIDPKTAAEWLATSPGNRRLRPRHVKNLARSMASGKWNPHGGSPLKLDILNRVIDGHHRLTAVIESGATIDAAVLRGVGVNAQEDEVEGVSWRAADLFYRAGMKYSHNLSAAGSCVMFLRQAHGADAYRMAQSVRPSASEVYSQFANCKPLEFWVGECYQFSDNRFPLSASELAAFMYFVHMDPANTSDKALAFVRLLTLGENIGSGHPVFAFRLRMLDQTIRGTNKKHIRLILLAKAWNAFVENRQISLLRCNASEEFPSVLKV